MTGLITLSWVAPRTNVDGTAAADIVGYRINYGTRADAMTASVVVSGGSATSTVLSGVSAGTYYLAVVAISSSGAVSDPTNPVVATVP